MYILVCLTEVDSMFMLESRLSNIFKRSEQERIKKGEREREGVC